MSYELQNIVNWFHRLLYQFIVMKSLVYKLEVQFLLKGASLLSIWYRDAFPSSAKTL